MIVIQVSDAWCTWWNYRVPKSDDWQCDLTTWKEQDSGRQVERKKKDAKNNPTVLAALVQSSCQRKMCKVENGIHYLCIHPGQTNKNDRPSFAPTTWNHCNSLIIHWTVWLIDIRDNFIIVQYCIGYINNYIDDKQYFNPKIVDGSPSFFIGLQILSVPRLAAIRYLLRCVEFVHTSRHCHE